MKARLLSFKELAPEVHHLEFEVASVRNFVFIPGQFVSFIEPAGGSEFARAYSIASPPNGNRFEICLNRVPGEVVSNILFGLKPGEEVEMNEPLGHFTFRRRGHRTIFIATGTGIAPFRSMLLYHLPKTRTQITLLFGVRCEEGLLYGDEFEKLAAQYENFRFLPTVSRPSSSWKGRVGRVQSHLDEALALHRSEDRGATDVYLCGLKEMVDDVRHELKLRDFDRKQIIYEGAPVQTTILVTPV